MSRQDRPPIGVEWLGDDGDDGDDGEELLSGGPGSRRWHRWHRWVPFVGVLALGGLVAGVLVSQHGPDRPVAAPTSPASTSTGGAPAPVVPKFGDVPTDLPTPPSPLDTPSPQLTAPRTTGLGHAILGITGGYELFARGPGVIERIQFAQGRVTATPVPVVSSTGPVFFVVGPHAALIRPLDFVPGYSLSGGRVLAHLAGALGHGGPIYPGPDPTHVWAEPDDSTSLLLDESNSLLLVDFHGHPTSTSIALPGSGGRFPLGPDGSGYVLVEGPSGVYDARPSGLTRITTGNVLAVGPTGWLVRECDRNAHCTSVYVDREDGSRRDVPGDPSGAHGVISPDGAVVALPEPGAGGPTLHLINLSTGQDRALDLRLPSRYGISQMAWSPDSRWLFVAGDQLYAVDRRTGHVHELGTESPALRFSQVAVRPAPDSRRRVGAR